MNNAVDWVGSVMFSDILVGCRCQAVYVIRLVQVLQIVCGVADCGAVGDSAASAAVKHVPCHRSARRPTNAKVNSPLLHRPLTLSDAPLRKSLTFQ